MSSKSRSGNASGSGNAGGAATLVDPREASEELAGAAAGPGEGAVVPPTVGVVGLPVQYHRERAGALETLAAVLIAKNRADDRWMLEYALPGAMQRRQQPNVSHSATPRAGYWTFLPG